MSSAAQASSREDATRSYGRGARILSVGIATTGLVTFAYFSLASHALSEVDYKGISGLPEDSMLWILGEYNLFTASRLCPARHRATSS